MVLGGITKPYSALESWAYDRWVAPGVVAFWSLFAEEIDRALPPGGCVLDVGCGGGHNLVALLKSRPDARATGLDLSKEQIARGRARARAEGLVIELVEGSALDLEDGRALLEGQKVEGASVARIPGTPALALRGRRL